MRESPLTGHLIGLHEELSGGLPGAQDAAVAAMRQRAITRLTEIGLPKITDEAWRYTNIRAFDKVTFRPTAESNAALTKLDIAALEIPSLNRYRIVILDGWVSEANSTLDKLPEGLEINRLKDVLEGNTDSETTQILDDQTTRAGHGFEALNCAFAADGVVLRLQAGLKLDKPLEILHITQNDANSRLANINHCITLEKGAKLNLIERYVSMADTRHMTNASIRIDLAESAELSHYRIQDESDAAMHIGYATARQDSGSCYQIFSISLGSLLDRHEVSQSLEGADAHCEMKGLYIGRGKQHIDNYTTVVHASPDASSDEFYKGILNDRSRAVFHGRIRVNPDAQHTDAQQQNRNLLLSTDAEADTKPQLEIYADDVKCSHGATVGYLEADAIFYLRSRGLSEAEARTILTEAFAAEILDQIELAPVREYLLELVRDKLVDDNNLKEAA